MRSVWDDNGHFSYHTLGNGLAETALAGWALLLRLMVRRGIRPVQRTRPPWLGTLDRTTLKLLDGLARRDCAHRGERNLKAGTVLVCDYQGRRRHGWARRLCLGGEPLCQPVGDRAGHYRDSLEWPTLLRPEAVR
jgi:hypothetical protein